MHRTPSPSTRTISPPWRDAISRPVYQIADDADLMRAAQQLAADTGDDGQGRELQVAFGQVADAADEQPGHPQTGLRHVPEEVQEGVRAHHGKQAIVERADVCGPGKPI